MKKIKAIFCDLDGTLLDNNTKLPHPCFSSYYLSYFDQNEIPFIMITGRLFEETYSIYKNLGEKKSVLKYLISSNGSQIYDTNTKTFIRNKVFSSNSINRIYESIKSILNDAPWYQAIIYKNNGQIIYWPDSETLKTQLKAKKDLLNQGNSNESEIFLNLHETNDKILENVILHQSVKPKQLKEAKLKDFEKLCKVVILLFDKNKEKITNFLKSSLADCDDVDISFSSSSSIEISISPYLKGDALKIVASLLDVKLHNVLSCGDSGNDISMFKTNVNSACPSWANSEVIAEAGHIFEGNPSEWILKAFDQYVIK